MPDPAGTAITVTVNGRRVRVGAHDTVAAAVALANFAANRRSVSGQARGPLCGMGVCMECVVTIDGRSGRPGCQTRCRDGMVISTGGENDRG